MGKYLEEFIKSIPAVQGKQILGVLNKQREDGSIRSIEEYQEKLREMTGVLSQAKPIPLSKLFLAEDGETIDSESFNFMLERFADDLDTLFKEIDAVSGVSDSHKRLMSEKTLHDLQSSLGTLNKRIKTLEILNRSDLGYSDVQYNDFSDTEEGRLSRANKDISVNDFFYDRVSMKVVQSSYDATIDILGKKLSNASLSKAYHRIINVETKFTSESRFTTVDVDLPELSIKNIIDGQVGTFWGTSILSDSIEKNGVVFRIEFTLDGLRDISFLEIEPMLVSNFYIKRIIYLDKNNVENLLSSDETLIDDSSRVDFDTITTEKIIIEFVQYNYMLSQYHIDEVDSLYNANASGNEIDFSILEQELSDLRYDTFLDAIGASKSLDQNEVKAYSYVIGFDNIKVGSTEYRDKGIYVAESMVATEPILLSIETAETYGYISGQSDMPEGSIEYYIYKRNYDETGAFIDTEGFPVLPYGQADIKKEYLGVNKSTRIAKLRFRAETGTIVVYLNDELTPLTVDVDYTISSDDKYITIESVAYDPFATYTVTYTPLREIYLNNAATVFINDDNTIEFRLERSAFPVASSNIYLQIILRRNILDDRESPYLNNYRLLVASKDDTRFLIESS